MKVLIIGQLPKEIGGNYTTGAANVAYELSVHQTDNVKCYTFGTNISNRAAQLASSYEYQFIGYSIKPWSLLRNILFHPARTYKHLMHYHLIDRQNVFRYYFYEDNIRFAIKMTKPDIIHVQSITNVSPTRYALDNQEIPIVLTCHGISLKGGRMEEADYDMYKGNLPFADYYTGSTKETALRYKQYLGIPTNRVFIIPNGIDKKKIFFNEESRMQLRSKYEVKEGQVVFLTIASVQERKGQLRFIKFLKQLKADFQYWLIGDGPDMPNIMNYLTENDMLDTVKRIGYVDGRDLYKFYSAADIYAHTSLNEGQALVELGANATGLRCVVSKEIVNTISGDINSESYYEIDFDKPDYASFNRWLNRSSKMQRIGSVPSWEEVSEMYRNLYNKVLKY